MKSLREYVIESSKSSQEIDYVYTVQDATGTILNVYTTKEDAEADANSNEWSKDADVKVVKMKRSEVEK